MQKPIRWQVIILKWINIACNGLDAEINTEWKRFLCKHIKIQLLIWSHRFLAKETPRQKAIISASIIKIRKVELDQQFFWIDLRLVTYMERTLISTSKLPSEYYLDCKFQKILVKPHSEQQQLGKIELTFENIKLFLLRKLCAVD